ncbi:pancreatic lipase-related protein 2-like [Culicoides brevitarsis]|uniref:pancreatic lipase-related protein 2-like n=1 Tax=Culicoides brevitarsis TaxID=469753 RepID=UPI00307B9175
MGKLLLLLMVLISSLIVVNAENDERDKDYSFGDIFTVVKTIIKKFKDFVFDGLQVADPIDTDTTFWCLNRESPDDEMQQVAMHDPKLEKKINLTKPIAFIIHGWIDHVNRAWVTDLMKDYIKYIDMNVCGVDWSDLATNEYVLIKKKYAPRVAKNLANFIKFLYKDHQVSYDDISLVGHGLGAHIAGFAGSRLKGKIGKIFALDPAGLLYTHPGLLTLGTTKDDRLDPSDAKYVQAIYTSRLKKKEWLSMGAINDIGHANFKPNGGTSPQPACKGKYLSSSAALEKFSCSHLIAVDYFRYALDPENFFDFYECTSKKCDNPVRLGVYADTSKHGNFTGVTIPEAPFTTINLVKEDPKIHLNKKSKKNEKNDRD